MLAGEIAFSSSTMKRLVEQSANDPESSKTQVMLVSISIFSCDSHFSYANKLFKALSAWIILQLQNNLAHTQMCIRVCE